MTDISIIRCTDYSPDSLSLALDDALQPFGGVERYVSRGARVLLKPNLVTASTPESAACTHPAFVEAVLRRVLDAGGKPIIGDSPAFGSAARVAEKAGIGEVARRYHVPIVDLSDRTVWVKDPGPSARPFKMSAAVREADVLINLPKLKVHRQMLLTAGVKNLFGCVPGKKKARLHLSHGKTRHEFATMILEVVRRIRPTLTLVDGIIAMERTGPRLGDPRNVGLILAGNDPVSIDRVCCDILGIPPETLAFIPAAREMGFGETELSRIRVHGVALDDAFVPDFVLPTLIPVTFSPIRILKSTLKDLWVRRVSVS